MWAIFESTAEFLASRLLAFSKGQPLDRLLVMEHDIGGVTPAMITWWWSNIRDTQRYKLWHPRDHISFHWEIPPTTGHVGTIQVAREKIGGIPAALRIRFDDPAGTRSDFPCLLAGSILGDDDTVLVRLTHEYGPAHCGTRMRSTFHLPALLYRFLQNGLRRHNLEEMSTFTGFLPELYKNDHEGEGLS